MLDSSSAKAPQSAIIDLGAWLQSDTGIYVRDWEQAHLNALTADIFGFHAVQIGLPQICTLQANRMPYRWLTDKHIPPQRQAGDITPEAGAGQRFSCGAADDPDAEAIPVVVSHDFTELPFASQSLDLVVLPHLLEFAAEPHQVLREVERVLIPEGQIIISGFNPASLWGMRQAASRLTGASFLPRDGEFISLPRLKDWLKLLNMEVGRGHFGCYAPPCATQKWLHRFGFMEPAGTRWWPYFGAVYVVRAIKRVQGMRLIGPVLNKRPAASARAVPAANRVPTAQNSQLMQGLHGLPERQSDNQTEREARTDG
ncbi:class I SAM-dependent methyltransferase [Oxalobacteraceae bacterium CAVE-383]|nr:class I SAM-dependent methyltransferase [Oxalobacteraceae bacterium CAVE-383]